MLEMEIKYKVYLLLAMVAIMGFGRDLKAQNYEKLYSLKGSWKFSIGDNKDWSKPNYDDRDWESIKAPSPWENQGYNGYDGYAWYRKHIEVPSSYKGKNLILRLGRIDDVDEVYFNGQLIGATGIFPPHYQSAYSASREYGIPEKIIRFDSDNLISVRVYDSQQQGGILGTDLALLENKDAMIMEVNLAGRWKFKTGDNMDWKNFNLDDSNWKPITVPGFWESQGAPDYDGFAWYRLKFFASSEMANKKWVLVLGRIDDIDETYLNEQLVGSTGDLNGNLKDFNKYNQYQQLRGYWLSEGALIPNKENVIAVRVYDGWLDGGIYQGPIGLIEQDKYVQYFKEHKSKPKKNTNFWNLIFD
jgi:hypothetical protein